MTPLQLFALAGVILAAALVVAVVLSLGIPTEVDRQIAAGRSKDRP